MALGVDAAEGDIPYFPRADANPALQNGSELPLERPETVGPVFNPEYADQPLPPFDTQFCEAIYQTLAAPSCSSDVPSSRSDSPETSSDAADSTPPKPPNFSDPYLFPMLAPNERLRLTMLWYYTRGITSDKEFLQKLSGLVGMVQQFMGWEFAIMGILDEAVYTRLVTSNLPIAMLPRRESTCSHTINQPGGSVFMLTSMLDDWRFAASPHVRIGGLRSYAGTQLRLRTETGQEIALGSLCIAANSPQEPLSPEKQADLVRFADILTGEIVGRLRSIRQRDRRVMLELLGKLRALDQAGDIEQTAVDALRKMYPDAAITVQKDGDGMARLEGRPYIPYSDVQDGLWEDVDYIDSAIQDANYNQLQSKQTVRAVVGRCKLTSWLVVVASKDMHLIFDDIDAWFVAGCALTIGTHLQAKALQEALKAKERFLRGITHQLRTPIHGVLGSAELLAEELATRNILHEIPDHFTAGCPSSYLATITNSGRELMSTVNNMLKLNSWAESTTPLIKLTAYNLEDLEAELLTDVLQMISEEHLDYVSIVFNNQLAEGPSVVTIDEMLLKECLASLLLNALQATRHGVVTVKISASADKSALQFDIEDTGCGIKQEDQQRIFEPYEKGDVHTRGAGLGLTIASKIAAVLNGSVRLVSSTEGAGSHFRTEFWNPVLACPIQPPVRRSLDLKWLPKTFYIAPSLLGGGSELTSSGCSASSPSAPLVAHFAGYLEKQQGLVRLDHPAGSLIILGYIEEDQSPSPNSLESSPPLPPPLLSSAPPPAALVPEAVAALEAKHVVVCIGVPLTRRAQMREALGGEDHHCVIFVSGPFYNSRLEDILLRANELYASLATEVVVVTTTTATTSMGAAAPAPAAEAEAAEKLSGVASGVPSENGPAVALPMRSAAGPSTASVQTPSAAIAAAPEAIVPVQNEPVQALMQAPLSVDAQRVAAAVAQGVEEQSPVPTALLVDDNAINLRILRMYCEKRNMPYVMATDGYEAIRKFKAAAATAATGRRVSIGIDASAARAGGERQATRPIQLTLLDLQMPHCDGVQACAQIRAWEQAECLPRSVIFMGEFKMYFFL